ncbi:MAG: 30S ribosomal protein S6 [Thermodesulfobacteriota bacterium]
MRRYECVVIIDPDISADERDGVKTRIQEIITQNGGQVLQTEDWGVKRLAYLVRKKAKGAYVIFDYCGMGPVVAEVERFCRISDKCLKYMTVVIDTNADPEAIKAEIASGKTRTAAAMTEPVKILDAADEAAMDEEDMDDDQSEDVEE